MQTGNYSNLNVRPDHARKVKIVNNWDHDYTETFRGEPVTIPAKGHIFMPLLDAGKFIGQAKPLAEKYPNGQYMPGHQPKMLQMIELTEQERRQVEGVTPEMLKRQRDAEAKRAALSCTLCPFQGDTKGGLKKHLTQNHPEAVPAALRE